MALLRWDVPSSRYINLRTGQAITPEPSQMAWDWGEGNEPWRHAPGATPWTAYLPAGVPVVPLKVEAGGNFENQLKATCDSAPGRVIVEMPDGVHSLTRFLTIGSGTNPTYAFGFWHPKLAGLLSMSGPEHCIVEMAPDSVNSAQLEYMAGMTQASFAPLQMGMMRIDTTYQSTAVPVYLGGITFEAAPQNLLTAIAPDVGGNVYLPQSAPHQGIVFYSGANLRHVDSVVTHTRARGAGKAMTSQPPFEMANFGSQRNEITFQFSEFDGRMSPRYDPTQPRKCGPFMANGGVTIKQKSIWAHDSNVSREAMNDESVESGTALSIHYLVEKVKIERITNTQNRQPPINGGNSLGGYTDASCFGYESSNALVEHIDVIATIDNPKTTGQVPAHIQFTDTGPARTGGQYVSRGGVYRHFTFPEVDWFHITRLGTSTAWRTSGPDNTMDVQTRMAPARQIAHIHTGAWPPPTGSLAAQGVTPLTHHIVIPSSV